MSWQADFNYILKNISAFNTGVGGRIDWPIIEEGTVLPAACFKGIDNDAKHTTTGTTWEYRDVQLEIHSADGDEVITLANILSNPENGIEGSSYGGIKNVFLIDDFDDKGTETKTARIVHIYRVEYKKTE